jgi:hypothetical protein
MENAPVGPQSPATAFPDTFGTSPDAALDVALDTTLDTTLDTPTTDSPFEASLEPLVDSVDFAQPQPMPSAELVEQVGLSEPAAEAGGNPFSNPFSQVAREISQFGNQEVQLAGLNYDLRVAGLDTQELRALFREAIEDSRFGWDTEAIMRQIKNGEVHLDQLNPVKAYILAKRLQFIDIEKSWKQNVLE